MRVADLLRRAVPRLEAAGVEGAARDGRILLAEAMGIAVDRLSLHMGDRLEPAVQARFEALLIRRERREPVAKIIGRRMFYGRDFRVTGAVLDPRPETEILIEAALAEPFGNVLDLGTGSGCILLTLLAERAGARGLGTDISAPALEVAAENAEALGVAERASLREGSWWQGVEGTFDLVVSNPPYISLTEMAALAPELGFDPREALTDEGDGLGAYRAILGGVMEHLAPGGRVLLEIGPGQGAEVSALARVAGLAQVRILSDFDGRDRVISARAPA